MELTVAELEQLFVKHRPEHEASPGARWNLPPDPETHLPHTVELLLVGGWSDTGTPATVIVRESRGFQTRRTEIPLSVLLELWPTIQGLLQRFAEEERRP